MAQQHRLRSRYTRGRPDAAKAAAKLSQFLRNPGPQHQRAVDRVICYLYITRYLALQWWMRFLERIAFKPSHTITLRCDNQQTVTLLTFEHAKIDTKLRHVDKMGTEVSKGRISIKWVPTARMAADGLTKLLPRQKHDEFVKMM
ncbi:uncharacterized protein N7473_000050 [Penicillium subrubescens]|uniref:uncharacterized protein n=1 Tax=Penicillium subrubescens TaxID=1316194 RepID=UPI002545AFEA|nr:uncharacterized protein N7473_000050 [Penicillium subrubescens]KAJ5910747.1 hypothetical protein N7473_000050 [Penicillium subrubescens]